MYSDRNGCNCQNCTNATASNEDRYYVNGQRVTRERFQAHQSSKSFIDAFEERFGAELAEQWEKRINEP